MSTALVWFRNDLRCLDNPALSQASQNHSYIIPLYIADEDPLNTVGAAQCWWLHHSLESLEKGLQALGLKLCLRQGDPLKQITALIKDHKIDAVYWNRCYEPASIKRDTEIKSNLKMQDLDVQTFNASLFNEPWTVLNQQKKYFSVFTPYWRQALKQIRIPDVCIPKSGLHTPDLRSDNLKDWNLLPKNPDWAKEFGHFWKPGEAGASEKLHYFIDDNLQNYKKMRDIPANPGTSRLSPHLHFGEISPWQIWRAIEHIRMHPEYQTASIEQFLSELGWREFAAYLLYHFPQLPQENFKASFDKFPWEEDEAGLHAWQKGLTGYPIVDAGMRELWRTGFMHNRVRMIVASFLIKDLHIDWRKGADWFLHTLLDADLANNSAGWQWVAGSGADAAPYFRIFNPILQGEKFDPTGDYIRLWIPELSPIPDKWIHKPWEAPQDLIAGILGRKYPFPLVDHAIAREIALDKYKKTR